MTASALALTASALDARAVIVHCRGDLDRVTAADAAAALAVAVRHGFIEIIVDLSGVARLDATGLAALVDGLRTAHRAGGSVSLAGGSPPVVALVARARLAQVLPLYPTVAAAQAAVRPRPAPQSRTRGIDKLATGC